MICNPAMPMETNEENHCLNPIEVIFLLKDTGKRLHIKFFRPDVFGTTEPWNHSQHELSG